MLGVHIVGIYYILPMSTCDWMERPMSFVFHFPLPHCVSEVQTYLSQVIIAEKGFWLSKVQSPRAYNKRDEKE